MREVRVIDRVTAICASLASVLLAANAAAQEMTAPSGRGPGYAHTSWATLHGDSSNSDYVPFATALDLERRWHVLKGAGIVAAPSVAADGRLFVTTGRGGDTAHLHGLSPAGELLWESTAVDSGAVLSAPVIGEDDDVYVGDVDEFHAFHPNGRRKWVVRLAALRPASSELGPVRGPFVTGMIAGEAVGGITVNGQVLLFDRATGELAYPILELPGGASPQGPVPDFLWKGGLVDPEIRDLVLEVLLGYRWEVTNTPAVHPETGRIYLMAAGRTLDEGLFYGIDTDGERLVIAFETKTAPGTGTSPAISPDGRLVYAFGGAGEIFAIDAETGAVVFERDVGGMQASPSVAADGSVYVLGEAFLRKLDGQTGDEKWSRNYDDFAAEEMREVSSWWPFVVSGKPVSRIDSVMTVTPNVVWTTLLCGYELRIFGRDLVQSTQTWLIGVDPRSGDLLEAFPIPDTSEGSISVGQHGEIYLDLLAIQASVAAHAPYRFLLPRTLRREQPQGGVIAFGPRDPREQIALGLVWAGRLLGSAAGGSDDSRERALVEANAQLQATQRSIARALGSGSMTPAEDGMLSGAISEALEALRDCDEAGMPSDSCARLAATSRTLRAYGEAFHRRIAAGRGAPQPQEVEKPRALRENYTAAAGGEAVPGTAPHARVRRASRERSWSSTGEDGRATLGQD